MMIGSRPRGHHYDEERQLPGTRGGPALGSRAHRHGRLRRRRPRRPRGRGARHRGRPRLGPRGALPEHLRRSAPSRRRSLTLDGQPLDPVRTRAAIAAGHRLRARRAPASRAWSGSMSVAENITLPHIERGVRRAVSSAPQGAPRSPTRWIERLRIRTPSAAAPQRAVGRQPAEGRARPLAGVATPCGCSSSTTRHAGSTSARSPRSTGSSASSRHPASRSCSWPTASKRLIAHEPPHPRHERRSRHRSHRRASRRQADALRDSGGDGLMTRQRQDRHPVTATRRSARLTRAARRRLAADVIMPVIVLAALVTAIAMANPDFLRPSEPLDRCSTPPCRS